MNVTLRPQSEALIQQSISRGEFSSPEELIDQALKHFLGETPEELDEIREAVEQAMQEEGGQPASGVFAELRAKHAIPS